MEQLQSSPTTREADEEGQDDKTWVIMMADQAMGSDGDSHGVTHL